MRAARTTMALGRMEWSTPVMRRRTSKRRRRSRVPPIMMATGRAVIWESPTTFKWWFFGRILFYLHELPV